MDSPEKNLFSSFTVEFSPDISVHPSVLVRTRSVWSRRILATFTAASSSSTIPISSSQIFSASAAVPGEGYERRIEDRSRAVGDWFRAEPTPYFPRDQSTYPPGGRHLLHAGGTRRLGPYNTAAKRLPPRVAQNVDKVDSRPSIDGFETELVMQHSHGSRMSTADYRARAQTTGVPSTSYQGYVRSYFRNHLPWLLERPEIGRARSVD